MATLRSRMEAPMRGIDDDHDEVSSSSTDDLGSGPSEAGWPTPRLFVTPNRGNHSRRFSAGSMASRWFSRDMMPRSSTGPGSGSPSPMRVERGSSAHAAWRQVAKWRQGRAACVLAQTAFEAMPDRATEIPARQGHARKWGGALRSRRVLEWGAAEYTGPPLSPLESISPRPSPASLHNPSIDTCDLSPCTGRRRPSPKPGRLSPRLGPRHSPRHGRLSPWEPLTQARPLNPPTDEQLRSVQACHEIANIDDAFGPMCRRPPSKIATSHRHQTRA